MKGVIKWLWMMTVLGIWVEVNGCLEQEKAALLQLKKNVGDQLPFKFQSVWLLDYLESWKEDKTSNCCDDWEGVACGLNYRVVSLSVHSPRYLKYYSLEMSFNASVLHPFEELRELNLTYFNIKSWDEDKGASKLSSKLKSLESLNLQYNNFDASSLSQLRGFLSLKYLFLDGNNLEGLQLHDIEAISQNLEELGLRDTEITGFRNNNGSTKLSSSLKVLDLAENMLDNNIISQLSGFQSLHTLYLEDSQLRGVVQLKALHQLKNLKELYLSDNSITGITNCNGSTNLSSSLKVLDLSYTTLDNNIISQLSGFQSLHTLYLRQSQLSGNVPINALHQLRNLEVLDLSENNITGVSNYNASFYGGTSLKKLDLHANQLAGEIPVWFRNLTSLETLDLTDNQLMGNIGSSPVIHLLSLKDLRVSFNDFQIPNSFQSFANHTKLKYFLGDSNKVVHDHDVLHPPFPLGLQLQVLTLSDCGLFTYPPFLPYQRDLMLVDLSDNSLQGEFPTWLFENNVRFDTLELYNNSLTGSLQLPSLTRAYVSRIYVGQNKIQGHIPANISAVFPKLVELDLSNNEFKGNIPSDIGDLKSLECLYLSDNYLSGKINSLSKSLQILDLSNNGFKGELPPTEGLLSLETLNLQGNNYSSGLRMNKFGPSLEVLNLSFNSLEGPLSKDIFSGSSKLFALDLSFNRLKGPLSISAASIAFLYLNNNRLSGQVTDAFCNATPGSTILDLSNNDLKGQIPDAVGNLTELKFLLLRGNGFNGQIPFQLCNLVYLKVLDLSSNDLNGPIPTCLGHISTMMYDFDEASIFSSSTVKTKLDLMDFNNPYSADHNFFHNKVEFMTKNMAYSYKGSILEYMSGIDLSCNKLTGHIPHELGNLSNIHALNLSHNQLRGVIPSTFSNLKSIESLDLSYNHLNGIIPSEVTNLDTLGVFNVSYNNLSGRIPFQAHSSTFDASSYKDNTFLCGLPLPVNCTTDDTPPTSRSESQDEDSGWIDMEAFYITFAGSGVTMFLAVVIVMLINPHWWNAWFYLAKACIFSGYYFFEDIIRKLMRARRV